MAIVRIWLNHMTELVPGDEILPWEDRPRHAHLFETPEAGLTVYAFCR